MNVGDIIHSRQWYRDMPIGSQVQGVRLWTKVEEDRWTSPNVAAHSNESISTNGDVRIVHLPPTCPFPVGHGLRSVEEFDLLPVGTIIGPGSHERYKKVGNSDYRGTDRRSADGWREGVGNSPHAGAFSMNGYNKILELPEGAIVGTLVKTLHQFKWDFRDNAIAAARRNGIAMDPVHKVLEELGCTEGEFPWSTDMRIMNPDDRARLPVGTLIYTGAIGQRGVSVFRKTREGRDEWTHILGDSADWSSARLLSIDNIEPSAEWFCDRTDQPDEVAEFKARAWRIGEKAKAANSWCGEFERAYAVLGITEECLRNAKFNGIGIGDKVDPSQAITLPIGSLFKWESSNGNGDWGVYRRADPATNAAGTRRVAGNTSGHYASGRSMTVLWIADEQFGEPSVDLPRTDDVWRNIPAGSVLRYQSEHYVKCNDGRMRSVGRVDRVRMEHIAAEPTGSYRASDFGDPVRWVRFGPHIAAPAPAMAV